MSAIRYSVTAYFLFAFAISWGGLYLTIGPGGFPGSEEDFWKLIVPVVTAMLLGPSIAGISMAALSGRDSFRNYLSNLKTFAVPGNWYVYALLIAPITIVVVLLALSTTSAVFTPGVATTKNPMTHVLLGLMTGAFAGMFEELGWTGFAIPRIRKRLSTFATGLFVGIIWGAWHLLSSWWGSAPTSGGLSMWIYLPALCFSFLPPYRILMVRLFDKTPSVPLAMLMHAALTASVRIFDPIGISGTAIVTYNIVLGAALWVVVAVVFSLDRRRS